jgi:PTH1 family peptidyl-tRNA hydrolase
MKLVVGLGNPGRKYQGTRHNVGYEVVAQVAQAYGTSKPRAKFEGELVEASIDGRQVLLLCPLTYMNNSGRSVRAARDFYKLNDEELLVVSDDANLPLAQLRFRAKGSSGGQLGLADVVQRLGTQEIARLRLGIGAAPPGWELSDWVLGRFTSHERPEIERAIASAAEAVADWVRGGTQYCMNRYNVRPSAPDAAESKETTGRNDDSPSRTSDAQRHDDPSNSGP